MILMAAGTIRQVLLESRRHGIPHGENLQSPIPNTSERQILIRTEFLSVEPAMRDLASVIANYSKPVAIVGICSHRRQEYLPGRNSTMLQRPGRMPRRGVYVIVTRA